MKKKIAAILSAAMIFVMGSTTVFAATSPVAEGVTPATLKEAVTTVTVAGETVEVGEITTSELASASQVAQTLVAGDVTSAAIVAAFDVPTGAGEATFTVNGVRVLMDKEHVIQLLVENMIQLSCDDLRLVAALV